MLIMSAVSIECSAESSNTFPCQWQVKATFLHTPSGKVKLRPIGKISSQKSRTENYSSSLPSSSDEGNYFTTSDGYDHDGQQQFVAFKERKKGPHHEGLRTIRLSNSIFVGWFTANITVVKTKWPSADSSQKRNKTISIGCISLSLLSPRGAIPYWCSMFHLNSTRKRKLQAWMKVKHSCCNQSAWERALGCSSLQRKKERDWVPFPPSRG